ncbi:hypothetical protein HYH03_004635 [Edaphochlamys debaryana]|uniref:Calcineurin-like phosphoesterase domain-containing protein n=1 Tax=Edaphochlamys debaryana TaxID=47281 RepID=A0A835Y9J5_9CHLO|nr:hypothetical protein HYH03_004635 [Edaphochlamys debaryana]|eukprot:KAG2497482.1 hypothetical protein HYH03_004635 [Edaphochlamys debaryana]
MCGTLRRSCRKAVPAAPPPAPSAAPIAPATASPTAASTAESQATQPTPSPPEPSEPPSPSPKPAAAESPSQASKPAASTAESQATQPTPSPPEPPSPSPKPAAAESPSQASEPAASAAKSQVAEPAPSSSQPTSPTSQPEASCYPRESHVLTDSPPSPSPPSPAPPSPPPPSPEAPSPTSRFVILGDFGVDTAPELSVSTMIDAWDAQERLMGVLTTGDNNYYYGDNYTMEANVGKYYHQYIYPYYNFTSPPLYTGAPDGVNRFFPTPGNHDWGRNTLAPYLKYFPGANNSYFYSVKLGASVEAFLLDSCSQQNTVTRLGNSPNSTQGNWLRNALAASSAPWKLVLFHHPPWSSGDHQNNPYMDWPFFAWGAHAVINGHDHSYERLMRTVDSCTALPYIVNGAGGIALRSFKTVQAGSVSRLLEWGAQLVTANATSLRMDFYAASNRTVRDSVTLTKDGSNPCGFTAFPPSPPPSPRPPSPRPPSPAPPPPPV